MGVRVRDSTAGSFEILPLAAAVQGYGLWDVRVLRVRRALGTGV